MANDGPRWVLTDQERRHVSELADEWMPRLKLGDLAEFRKPQACGCMGGYRAYPAPCYCQLGHLAMVEALLRCGLTWRTTE